MTLPGRGTLELDGVHVRAGDSVSQARVDAGDLTYTPPRGQVGKRTSYFTFKVNDGELESARSSKITIDVDNTLVGNLDQAASSTILSLPNTDVNPNTNAYAQAILTGSSAQELDEVKLAITVPSGTTPKVSIWYGVAKPEQELTGLTLSNPSNIHSTATVKTFKANSKTNGRYSLATDNGDYWIVVERASGSGTISLKLSRTANIDPAHAQGWGLYQGQWKRSGNDSWSLAGALSLFAELRTVPSRQLSVRVLDMEILGPGPDELYTHGEELEITATLSEVGEYPRNAEINLPPHFCGR